MSRIECEGQDHGDGLRSAFERHRAREADKAWRRLHYPGLPEPVRITRRAASDDTCQRCNGDGVIHHYSETSGDYVTPCGCQHGMTDSHYL